jgi:hypothetical protein
MEITYIYLILFLICIFWIFLFISFYFPSFGYLHVSELLFIILYVILSILFFISRNYFYFTYRGI